VPNHATRPLGQIERHYCGQCGYLFLSHGGYTLHPCDAFVLDNLLVCTQWGARGGGITVWQSDGLAAFAAWPAEQYSDPSGDILGYDDQQIVMTEVRITQPRMAISNTVFALGNPNSVRRIPTWEPGSAEADFRSTRPVRLGDVLCQDGGNRLRPGRIGDSPHGIVTEVHRAVTVADDDVLLRYRWEGTLVFSGPFTVRAGDIPIVFSGFERPSR
jgi:hypothetical protein